MKIKNMKLIGTTKTGRSTYEVVLRVTDIEIEMLEDLADCYCTRGTTKECELKLVYQRWLEKTYHEFWKLWHKYDELKFIKEDNNELDSNESSLRKESNETWLGKDLHTRTESVLRDRSKYIHLGR